MYVYDKYVVIEGYLKYNAEKLRLSPQDAGNALLQYGKDDQVREEVDVAPQVFYYGMQIHFKQMRNLTVNFDTFLPEFYMSFTDYSRIMSDAGFPVDDSYVTLYVPARNRNVRPIFMNFKILHFDFTDETGEAQMHIWGVCDASQMFVNEHKSYDATSWEVMKSLAESTGLGFASNVGATTDKMVWINPGDDVMAFAKEVAMHSWNGESSFMLAYVDPYYNLCFVDVEKAMQADLQRGLVTVASERTGQKSDDADSVLVLSNDKSFQATNVYFSRYRVINQSTAVSMRNGYRREVFYYDRFGNWKDKAGTFLTMTVDSITTPGAESTSVILKGQPTDKAFYEANVGLKYAGKYDKDNMHRDYHYASVQNEQNLEDAQKVYVRIVLPVPNYTVTKMSKVRLAFSNQGGVVGNAAANQRLSGSWLVTGISYRFTGRAFEQTLTLLKRELNVTDPTK